MCSWPQSFTSWRWLKRFHSFIQQFIRYQIVLFSELDGTSWPIGKPVRCVRFFLCLLYNLYRARRFRGRIPKDGHEYREEDRNERHQSSSKWTGKSVVKCKYKIPLERPYHILSSPEHNLLPKIRPNILTEIISCKNSVVLLQQVYYYFCFSNVWLKSATEHTNILIYILLNTLHKISKLTWPGALSSGYGRKLMLWVRIPATYTGWTILFSL